MLGLLGIWALVALVVSACQSADPGGSGAAAQVAAPQVTAPQVTAPAVLAADPAAEGADGFASAICQVAQQVKPAVVQITNEQVQLDQFNQPFTVPAGVGSGEIYDAQGHILTNAHVVAGARQLLVSLPDGRSFPGHLIGADTQTDLAVVQISGDTLPVAPLGDSSQLQVGDWVVAIGNALALPGGPTVSQGVVSALGRTVQEPGGSGSRCRQIGRELAIAERTVKAHLTGAMNKLGAFTRAQAVAVATQRSLL